MRTTDADMLESGLIRAVVKRPDSWPELAAIVKPRHFQLAEAMRAWVGIGQNWRPDIDEGELFANTYVALADERAKAWFFDTAQEMLFTYSPDAALNAAERIAEAANVRRLCADLQALALKGRDDANCDRNEMLRDLSDLYRNATEDRTGGPDASIAAAIGRFNETQRQNRERGCIGWRTGFELLHEDGIVYQPGHLWVIGGRTNVGKSAWMIEALCRFFACNPERRTAIFSTEMTEAQNIARLLANRTGYSANVIAGGRLFPQHEERVEQCKAWLAEQRVHIHTRPRALAEIATICRKLNMADGGLDMVWIDFIQNVTAPAKDDYARMSDIARSLQSLALELECTIVCLSQLSNMAAREEHDNLEFKGAGEIAAACDIGVFLKCAKQDKAQLLFEVKKNRHGKCGTYRLQFAGGWTKIEEIARVED